MIFNNNNCWVKCSTKEDLRIEKIIKHGFTRKYIKNVYSSFLILLLVNFALALSIVTFIYLLLNNQVDIPFEMILCPCLILFTIFIFSNEIRSEAYKISINTKTYRKLMAKKCYVGMIKDVFGKSDVRNAYGKTIEITEKIYRIITTDTYTKVYNFEELIIFL